MTQIKTWKAFYKHLCPKRRQSTFHQKVYRKAFSIIARNRWVCFKTDEGVIIKHTFRGFNLSFKMSKLSDNAKWTKIPQRLTFSECICPSGLTFSYNLDNLKAEAIMLIDGSIKMVNYRTLNDLILGDVNVLKTFPNKKTLRNEYINLYPDKFEKVNSDYKTIGVILMGDFLFVKEDFLWYKRGQIIKKYVSDFEGQVNREPQEIFEDKYGTCFSLVCDLNHELKNPELFNCQKRQFGCDFGCRDSCQVSHLNKRNIKLYNLFLKYKEMI